MCFGYDAGLGEKERWRESETTQSATKIWREALFLDIVLLLEKKNKRVMKSTRLKRSLL